jgi:hypothetical protein
MSAATEPFESAITDPAEAQKADFGFRMLRFSLAGGGTQWIFVTVLLALQKHKLPLVVVIPLAVLGVTGSLWTVRYFTQRHRTVLASFIDRRTGRLRIPGDRQPIPRRFVIGGVVLLAGEVAFFASGLAANYGR